MEPRKFNYSMKSKLLFIFIFCGGTAFAQNNTESAFWFKAGKKLDLNKKHSLNFSGHYRAASDSHNRWITEVQFSREHSKNWDLGLELRHNMNFYTKDGIEETSQRVRAQFFASRHVGLSKGELHIRCALQQRRVLTGLGNDKFMGRFRVQYDYPIKNFKWDPTFEAEFFAAGEPNFDRALRMGVSTDAKAMGKKLGFKYFYQRDFSNNALHAHVLQTSVRF